MRPIPSPSPRSVSVYSPKFATAPSYLQSSLSGLPEPSPPSSPPAEGAPPPTHRPSIPFSTLVPRNTCTRLVAAKGLYQVLVLATRNVVGISQTEANGEILIWVKEEGGTGGGAGQGEGGDEDDGMVRD